MKRLLAFQPGKGLATRSPQKISAGSRLSNNIKLRSRVNLLWSLNAMVFLAPRLLGRLVTKFILSFSICAVILAALGTHPHRVEFVLVQSEFVRGFLTVLLYVSLVSVLPWQVGLWWSGRDEEALPISEGFRRCGPLIITTLIIVAYGRMDYVLSLTR